MRRPLMKPNVYTDVRLRAGTGFLIPVLAGQVVQTLHTVIARHPNQFALAFPKSKGGELPTPGQCIRVFATDLAFLEGLINALEDSPFFSATVIEKVRDVPENWAGPWVSYERFRIPSRRGKGTPEQLSKRQRLRHKRLEESRTLPFLKIHSGSTGQRVVLTFSTRTSSNCDGGGEPDAYGLSRPETTVWLPLITS